MAVHDTSTGASGQRSGARSGADGASKPSAADESTEIGDSLGRSAQHLTKEIRREGRRLFADASESANAAVVQRQDLARNYLAAVSEAVQSSAQVLEDRGYAGSAQMALRASDGIERLVNDLTNREPKELVNDAVDYARRNPAIFMGAAVLAGFAMSRVLRSTADEGDAALETEDSEADYDSE